MASPEREEERKEKKKTRERRREKRERRKVEKKKKRERERGKEKKKTREREREEKEKDLKPVSFFFKQKNKIAYAVNSATFPCIPSAYKLPNCVWHCAYCPTSPLSIAILPCASYTCACVSVILWKIVTLWRCVTLCDVVWYYVILCDIVLFLQRYHQLHTDMQWI